MKRKLAWLILVTSLVLGTAGPLVSETWTAELGWSGLVVPGTWAPLRVEVTAAWGPWTLEVERPSARAGGRSVEAFQRPAGGRFETALWIPEDCDNLILRAIVDGQVRAERTLEVGAMGFPGHVIGVSGLPPGAHRALSGVLEPDEPVRLVDLPPRRWPTQPLAWLGLSALVLPDPGPVLSPAQSRALRSWLDQGGRVILLAPRPASESLASQLGTGAQPPAPQSWGRVSPWEVAPTSRDLLQTSVWKAQLNLPAFLDQPSVSRALRAYVPEAALELAPLPWLAPVAALWVAACLVLVVRRRGSSWWAIGTSSVALVALLASAWWGALPLDRGTTTQTRLVLLPNGEGLELGSVSAQARAPWSWATQWDAQPVTLDAVEGTKLTHLASPSRDRSEVSLGVSGPLRSSWGRWLTAPELEARALGPAPYRLTMSAGRPLWSTRSEQRWVAMEQVPQRLKADEPWLKRVALCQPSQAWEVGQVGNVVWIQPVSGAPL